ncbi:cation:proton antiporter [Liberiplasma polymorphum]|uniref:cation:proton antiporter n=1 Tax=Liberiplasma polymorphum TaxID=3374570 RepID=UPI003770CABD
MIILEYIAIAILVLSWVFIIFGMGSIFKLKNLYTRILSAATIDTVASLSIILALLIANITDYSYVIRFILLIGFLLMTNPISAHVNIRSAFLSGIEIRRIHHKGKLEEEKRKRDELYG